MRKELIDLSKCSLSYTSIILTQASSPEDILYELLLKAGFELTTEG